MEGKKRIALYLMVLWGSMLGSAMANYPTERFSTEGATPTTYEDFIQALRNRLANPSDSRHGIPVLYDTDFVDIDQRFVYVELSNEVGLTITLALDVTTANVVGYRAGEKAYFFRPSYPNDPRTLAPLFKDTASRRETFKFAGSYGQLETIAGQTRDTVNLGSLALENAVSLLFFYPTGAVQRTHLAQAFLVCMQMVSEAARFRQIELTMSRRIMYDQVIPADPGMLSLENNWEDLSRAVQMSDKQGYFSPIPLKRFDGSEINLDNVRRLFGVMSLIRHRCDSLDSSKSRLLMIRPVVSNFTEGVCEYPEPTTNIIGKDRFCVQLSGPADGSKVTLFQCSQSAYQMWTFKRDGTIRCSNKCLTASSYIPGSNVIIQTCTTALSGAIRWDVLDDGTIKNRNYGLVLAATLGSTLTVETNNYDIKRGWLQTKTLNPYFVASILGMNDLCLQEDGTNVWLDDCGFTRTDQKWVIYEDGSIRPQRSTGFCITTAGTKGSTIRLLSCAAGSSGQRWVMKNDGTIWNLRYKLVLDVLNGDPTLKQIDVGSFTGAANQKWLQMF